MTERTWTRAHAEMIRGAAPEVPEFEAAAKAALWQRVEEEARVQPPRQRKPWKVALVGLAAAVVVGGTGVATATVLTAHTGEGPSDAEDLTAGGPGERLLENAPDFPVVLDHVTHDIRFPSAQSRRAALAQQVDASAFSRPGADRTMVSTGAERLWVAGTAVCAWTNTWAEALEAGDRSGQARAASVVRSSMTWPAVTDTDPDHTILAWLPGVADAVEAGDLPTVKRLVHSEWLCSAGVAPALDVPVLKDQSKDEK